MSTRYHSERKCRLSPFLLSVYNLKVITVFPSMVFLFVRQHCSYSCSWIVVLVSRSAGLTPGVCMAEIAYLAFRFPELHSNIE